MKILKAISLRQLQTFNYILQVLENYGVPDLPTARLLVSRETNERHKERRMRKRGVVVKIEKCPECGFSLINVPTVRKPTEEIPLAKVEVENKGLRIKACKKCGYSKILGDS